ncbi:hypothetical protein [Kineococcus rhizosphaerae]|uniref:Uncharacterized protein n=1 Tax=Kineococcus rhizosphaerae TaxID=559628 RepID=A0A2T0QTJ4_9ACTN|nr:hypothetical protein [Kineococcus rhizosphaerae]PRY08310.1 hypothetical protein CLV37_12514 [Kineococcus rhizosphaerae]
MTLFVSFAVIVLVAALVGRLCAKSKPGDHHGSLEWPAASGDDAGGTYLDVSHHHHSGWGHAHSHSHSHSHSHDSGGWGGWGGDSGGGFGGGDSGGGGGGN